MLHAFVTSFVDDISLPDPTPQDMPDDHCPDPDDAADFELSDQQELINAFMAGMCKESQHACSCLDVFLFRDNNKVRERVLHNTRTFCIGMDSRAIAAKKWY